MHWYAAWIPDRLVALGVQGDFLRMRRDFLPVCHERFAPYPVLCPRQGESIRPRSVFLFEKAVSDVGLSPAEESMKRIYVGNLPFSATEDEVNQLFAQYGSVLSVSLITDRDTGAPRGFGFVEMEDGVDDAINALNNYELGGRNLRVNEARPREGGGGRGPRW